MNRFENQTVLVTGSTRGIGKAAAKLFIEEGAHVIVTGTSDTCPVGLNDELGSSFSYVQGNFSSAEGISSFIEALKKFDRIDVCVNNAGINRLFELEDIPLEDYNELLSVNLHAPVQICKSVAKLMKKQNYGRVVNVASIWSAITKPKRTMYTISKNAIVGLTKTMAVELAPYGVTVNAISPGFTLTELTKSTLTEDEIKTLSQDVPAKRFAEPEEMAKVILFLCSKENSYMTGQNIIVDGGYTNV